MDRRAFLGLFGAVAASCAKDRSARSAAEHFLDKYYVERDLKKALEITIGPAADRVKGELEMLETTRRQSGHIQSQVQPKVFYERKHETWSEDGAETVEFELKVDSGGVRLLKRVSVVLSLEHTDAGAKIGYRVVAFSEADTPAP
jgi:hypothetical protein